MKRKSLSLKKLYLLASDYLLKVTKEENFNEADRQMKKVIRPYLKFVAENWQKDL